MNLFVKNLYSAPGSRPETAKNTETGWYVSTVEIPEEAVEMLDKLTPILSEAPPSTRLMKGAMLTEDLTQWVDVDLARE